MTPGLAVEAWRRGRLRYKLDDCKRSIYDEIVSSEDTFVMECARKVGKSYLAVVLAFERAIRQPGARVNYACTTAKAVKEILLPISREILADCPAALKPEWKRAEEVYAFRNGSRIVVSGAEDELRCDRLRGPAAHFSVVDEGGFITPLRYLVTEVLAPQHVRTGGLMLLLSSPAKTPDHEFSRMADAARGNGRYAHRDLYSPGLAGVPNPDAYVERCARTMGLSVDEYRQTPAFQREILGLRVMDERRAAVPEWHHVAAECTRESPRPAACLQFVSIDPAYSVDAAGVLFGHFNFVEQRLVIEDELLLRRAATRELGQAIVAKEAQLGLVPALRVVDDSQGRLRADLFELAGLVTAPALKDGRDNALALMRTWFGQRKVVVSPRCERFIYQLRNGMLSKSGDFERDEDGHCDLLAACMYLVRAVNGQAHVNPQPFVPTYRNPVAPPRSRLLQAMRR